MKFESLLGHLFFPGLEKCVCKFVCINKYESVVGPHLEVGNQDIKNVKCLRF